MNAEPKDIPLPLSEPSSPSLPQQSPRPPEEIPLPATPSESPATLSSQETTGEPSSDQISNTEQARMQEEIAKVNRFYLVRMLISELGIYRMAPKAQMTMSNVFESSPSVLAGQGCMI